MNQNLILHNKLYVQLDRCHDYIINLVNIKQIVYGLFSGMRKEELERFR